MDNYVDIGASKQMSCFNWSYIGRPATTGRPTQLLSGLSALV